jgi:hypothetical protein
MALRLCLFTAVVLAAMVLLGASCCESRPDVAPWDWPDAYRALTRAQARGAELDKIHKDLGLRYHAKCAVALDLAAGRLTLPQAVAEFRALVQNPAWFWEGLRREEAGASDEERLYRHVVAWAESTVAEETEQRVAVAARLEVELQHHVRQLHNLRFR